MKKTKRLINLSFFLSILFLIASSYTLTAGQKTASSTGDWSNTGTWAGGTLPTSDDTVWVKNNVTVSVDGDYTVTSMSFTGTGKVQPKSTGTYTITVTGSITVASGSNTNFSGSNSNGRLNLIMDNTSSMAIACNAANNMVFNDFTLTKGSAATINKSFKLGGDLTLNDNSSFTQSSGTCTITGTNSSITVPTLGTLTLKNIKLASTASNVTTSSNFSVSEGYFHLENGAKFTASSGTITISSSSGVKVSPYVASGTAADLKFSSVVFSLSSSTLSPSTGFTVTANMDKSGTGLFYPSAGAITFDNNASENSPKYLNGNSNLNFFNLTVTDGSHITTGSSATINGRSTGGNSLTVQGTGTFKQTAGTMTFVETSSSANVGVSVSNNGKVQLNNVVIYNSSNCSFLSTSDVIITGNLTAGSNSSCSFTTPSTVYFKDVSGHTGTHSLTNNKAGIWGMVFNNLELTDSQNQTKVQVASGSKTITLLGDLTINGNSYFDASTNSNTISFRGSSAKTLTNEGTCNFSTLEVADESGNILNTSSDFSVANYLYLGSSSSSGALNASGNSTITFSKDGDPFQTTTQAAHSFQNLKITAASEDADNANNLIIKGDLIVTSGNSLSYTGSDGDIKFNGTSQQKIYGGGTIILDDVVLDNSNGLVLENNLQFGDASQAATFTLTNGDCDLNGDYYITFSNTGCALRESTGNTIINTKSATTGGYIQASTSCNYDRINNYSGLGLTGLTAGTDITVRRYQNAREVDGYNTVKRYYYISGTGVKAGTLAKFAYDESELNGNTEENLVLYATGASNANVSEFTSSQSSSMTKWYGQSGSVSTSNNYVGKQYATSLPTGYYVAAPRFLKITYFPTTSIEDRNKVAESPLAANATNKTILGFGLTSSADANSSGYEFTALNVSLSRSSAGIFSNFELYKDVDDDMNSYDYGSAIATGSVSGNNVQFSSFNQSLTMGTTVYYFIVADVDATVNSSTSNIYASIDQDDITMNKIEKKSQTITGPSYSFASLSVALSSSNAPSAGPLELNKTSQTIYGFKLTPPTGAGTVTFNQVNIKVTVANGAEYDDFTNFKLYKDANRNGIKDGADGSDLGSITNIDENTGILTYSSLGESLTAGEGTEYILIADVKSDANVSGTIKCKISSYSDVTLASPATIPSGGPYEGNQMTVRSAPTPGSPTTLSITAFGLKTLSTLDDKSKGTNEIVKSANVIVQVQAKDASGYPQKVDQATTVTLTALGGTTLGGTNTVSLAVNNSTGSTEALTFGTASTSGQFSIIATVTSGMSLTADTLSGITVYSIEPTSFFTGTGTGSVGATTASITWTNSSSEYALVVVKAGGEPSAPTDGTDYNASTDFSSPSTSNGTTGTGSVVVYEGTGNSVSITGLSANTTYYATIYKFKGSGLGTNYLTADYVSGPTYNTYKDRISFTTKYSAPTSASSNMTFASVQANSMKISWTKPSSGGGTYSLVVVGTSDPSTVPTDTVSYTANTVYGEGSSIGTGSSAGYVVYTGDGNTVTVTGLTNDQVYYVRVYEFNGSSGKENYLTSQYLSDNRRTLDNEPSVQAHDISFSNMTTGTNTQVTVNWIRGDGDYVLVVAKVGSAITSNETPSDQTAVYTSANAAYGTGDAIGQGYVVYKGTGNQVTVTSLQYGQTYYFKAFEYNAGSGTNTTTDNSTVNYNTDDATDNPNSRIADSYEPNDALANAKFISSDGTLYTGIISSATDADWFSFRPDFENSYKNIRIKLTGLPQNYTIELYRADGRLLRRSTLSGTSDETLILNNLPEADYYVKIYSADGEYSLTPYRVNILNRTTDYKADTQ